MIRFGFLTVCLVCHLQPTKVCNVLALFEGNDFANEIYFDTWVLIPFTLRLSSSSSVKLLYWSIMHLAMLRYLSINNYNCDVKITTSVGRRIKIEKNGRV